MASLGEAQMIPREIRSAAMTFRFSHPAILARACALSLWCVGSAHSQEMTLDTLATESRAAMEQQAWERALDLNTQAIARFGGGRPLREYGPQFGIIFYRKGLCEMKLKRWKEAMASFETCYRDFPNGKAVKDGGNIDHKMALLKWAESAMGAEEWEVALARFAKFINERDRLRDKFPQGSYQVNLAICHYKLGNIVKGSENLEIAIRNRTTFPTPPLGIMAGFQELVGAAIRAKNEQALLDFIGKNRGGLSSGAYEMYQFSPVFMKLAGDAIGAGLRRAALALYQFIPSTDVAIDDVRARLKAMGAAAVIELDGVTLSRVKLEEDLAAFEADRRGKRATEPIKLAAVAFIHEASGNFPGALAAYQQMESYYPGAEKHEENLFNLVRVAARIGWGTEVRRAGAVFLKDFPQSGKVNEMRRLILTSLESGGDAGMRIAIAGPMLEGLREGTPEHEWCLFILGVSYFNSGAHDKARETLDRHVGLYPAGDHAVEAAFYQACNAARLGEWELSATRLDAFLAAHPENPWLAPAIYERAAVHLVSGQQEAALAKLNRLIKDFPDSEVNVRALNLLGDVESSMGNAGGAEKAYQMALKAAEISNDRPAAGEALCRLVEVLVNAGDGGNAMKWMKDAVSYADRYWKEYAEGSLLRTRVAVAQVPAYVRAGRGEEALERLLEIAAKGGGDPSEAALLIDTYAGAYLSSHGPESLEKQLESFPLSDPPDKVAQAHLRLAIIGAYEKEARAGKDDTRKTAALGKVKMLYQKMKADFAPGDLDPQSLVRLGDHLRLYTSTPREALGFYDEAIGRKDPVAASAALIGRADIRVRSTVAAEIDQGIDDFRKAGDESKIAAERGYARFRMVESLMAKGDFTKAAGQAVLYLDSGGSESPAFIPQLGLMLARAYQELKRTDEAIDAYARVWSAHTDDVEISAPAMGGWMQLLWTRNREGVDPTDRQTAYEGGWKYLDRTRSLTAGLKEVDLGPWREVEEAVKTFATSPGIKPIVTSGGVQPPTNQPQR